MGNFGQKTKSIFSQLGLYTLSLLDTFREPLLRTLYIPLTDFAVISQWDGKRYMNVISSLDVFLKILVKTA